jgi:type IV pilus assembly protein PilC
MLGTVKTGEKTGRLGESLAALAEYYERLGRMGAAVRAAVLYPAILLCVMVGVVLVLIVRVLPIFNGVFERMGSQMPPLALRFMQFGEWLGGALGAMAAVAAALLVAGGAVLAFPKARAAFFASFLKRFGGRGILRDAAASRFVSVMVLSLASGLEVDEAVGLASSLSGGAKELDARNAKCAALVGEGRQLADAMREAKLLSPRDGRLLPLGSQSGAMDSAMADIARRMELDVQARIDRAISRIEPALVISASALVGAILLSVMLPLMGIMTSIG